MEENINQKTGTKNFKKREMILTDTNRNLITSIIQNLTKGSDYRITVDINKGKRSLPQNNLLFGHLYKLCADYTGHTVDEMHEYFKLEFLSEVRNIMGKDVRVVKSTTKLSVQEFNEYVEKIINFGKSNGIKFDL